MAHNKSVEELEHELEVSRKEFDEFMMEATLSVAEFFDVLKRLTQGDFEVRAKENSSQELFANFGKVINETIVKLAFETRQLEEARSRSEVHARDLEATLRKVRAQQDAIAQLSTPIIQVWDRILCLPIVGIVDSKRAGEMMDTLLNRIIETDCRFVIVDITGVDVFDTQTADHFVKMIRAASLLGVQCMITGIKPQIAQTMTTIGVNLGGIVTLRNLEAGLLAAIKGLGYRVAKDA